MNNTIQIQAAYIKATQTIGNKKVQALHREKFIASLFVLNLDVVLAEIERGGAAKRRNQENILRTVRALVKHVVAETDALLAKGYEVPAGVA